MLQWFNATAYIKVRSIIIASYLLIIDCVNATTWCETFTSGNCQAKVGAEIIIPCGNLPLSPGITFTYINQSAQDVGRSSFVLARNVSDCLKLNLTVYDDRKRITCQASNTMGASYSFILIVKCKFIRMKNERWLLYTCRSTNGHRACSHKYR